MDKLYAGSNAAVTESLSSIRVIHAYNLQVRAGPGVGAWGVGLGVCGWLAGPCSSGRAGAAPRPAAARGLQPQRGARPAGRTCPAATTTARARAQGHVSSMYAAAIGAVSAQITTLSNTAGVANGYSNLIMFGMYSLVIWFGAQEIKCAPGVAGPARLPAASGRRPAAHPRQR